MKIFVRTVLIILGLIVVALAFVFFSPDYALYFVRSESMVPAINLGDMVIAGPAGTIKPGDIITYELGKNLITHRVLSVDGDTIVNGDLGLSPGTAVTGFPPGIVNGTMHVTNETAL